MDFRRRISARRRQPEIVEVGQEEILAVDFRRRISARR